MEKVYLLENIKLNKYLVYIIYEYVDQRNETIIEIYKKNKYKQGSYRFNVSIADIFSRCANKGYASFCISKNAVSIIRDIDSLVKRGNCEITKFESDNDIIYELINTNESKSIDFFMLGFFDNY